MSEEMQSVKKVVWWGVLLDIMQEHVQSFRVDGGGVPVLKEVGEKHMIMWKVLTYCTNKGHILSRQINAVSYTWCASCFWQIKLFKVFHFCSSYVVICQHPIRAPKCTCDSCFPSCFSLSGMGRKVSLKSVYRLCFFPFLSYSSSSSSSNSLFSSGMSDFPYFSCRPTLELVYNSMTQWCL